MSQHPSWQCQVTVGGWPAAVLVFERLATSQLGDMGFIMEFMVDVSALLRCFVQYLFSLYFIWVEFWHWLSLYIWSRFAVRHHPPPPWYGPKTCVLQHSAWKRVICSVFCTVGGWRGPQTCKFVGFLQPAFRKRVICYVSASTSWSSAVAPPSMSIKLSYNSKSSNMTLPSAKCLQPRKPIWFLSISYTCQTFSWSI